MKKILWFISGGIMAVVFYLAGIGVYTRISDDPIIFFASLVIAIISGWGVCFLIRRIKGRLFDRFTLLVMGIVYCLGIVIIAVFGPTFIDRSISYHMVFYAAEEDVVYMKDIEELSTDIFQKRIHDATATGFFIMNEDGSMSPTFRAKAMYYILKPLGELTGSMDTYHEMREEIQNNAVHTGEN